MAYSESKDLKTWSEPKVILTPDEFDTNDFYAFQVFRYADYYLGQLWIYDDDVGETIEIELAWSHDGIHWSRLPDRPKFLQRGRPGEQDGYMINPAQAPVGAGSGSLRTAFNFRTFERGDLERGKGGSRVASGRGCTNSN